jgi:hypothetical protein
MDVFSAVDVVKVLSRIVAQPCDGRGKRADDYVDRAKRVGLSVPRLALGAKALFGELGCPLEVPQAGSRSEGTAVGPCAI